VYAVLILRLCFIRTLLNGKRTLLKRFRRGPLQRVCKHFKQKSREQQFLWMHTISNARLRLRFNCT
jgi:hypothetical protein